VTLAFDSADATMRMAALTGTSEDVDELAKTLKIERPSAKAISREAPAAKAPRPVSPAVSRPAARQIPAEPPARSGGGNLMLIAIVVLVLLGIAAILVA